MLGLSYHFLLFAAALSSDSFCTNSNMCLLYCIAPWLYILSETIYFRTGYSTWLCSQCDKFTASRQQGGNLVWPVPGSSSHLLFNRQCGNQSEYCHPYTTRVSWGDESGIHRRQPTHLYIPVPWLCHLPMAGRYQNHHEQVGLQQAYPLQWIIGHNKHWWSIQSWEMSGEVLLNVSSIVLILLSIVC